MNTSVVHGLDRALPVHSGPRRPDRILICAAFVVSVVGFLQSASQVAFAQDNGGAADSVLPPDKLAPDNHCDRNNQVVTFSGTTTWDLCFRLMQPFGLVVQRAQFRREPGAPFVLVLFDGRISEIFVPYHPGLPRFFDISNANPPLLTLDATDCPPPRTLIGNGKVCREIRDRGLAWKDDGLSRRGEELALWSVLDAGNYNYILEWAFRDDGSIAVRAGSTGPKLHGPDDPVGHMHSMSWRLDIDLNGAGGDSVFRTEHIEDLSENPSDADDNETLIATEGGRTWVDTSFSSLDIEDDTLQNGRGRPTSYELVPYRTGTGRQSEDFTKSDFWVTVANPSELFARDVTSYVNGQDTSSADVVVWYTGSEHHENGMRDEDRDAVPVLWTGFELRPKNLFDGTPLYP